MSNDINVTEDYIPLHRVLMLAYEQSSSGKGKNRHANGKAFLQQPIMEIGRMVGIGYQLGQAMKKAQEAGGMASRGQIAAAQAELLGAINYLAAAHIQLGETAATADVGGMFEPDGRLEGVAFKSDDKAGYTYAPNTSLPGPIKWVPDAAPDNKPICLSCGRNRDKAPAATCATLHLHQF